MAPADALVGETDAFLAGELADYLVASGRHLPAWTAVNFLAHGTREQLEHALTTDRGWRAHPSIGDQRWLAAKRSLIGRLVDNTKSTNDLRRIQEAVLVPLELRLIHVSRRRTLSSAGVIEEARQALDEHPVG